MTLKKVNRYRRGLETCQQAKTFKSEREYFSFFRRIRAKGMTQRRVENTRVHFRTFSPVSVNKTFSFNLREDIPFVVRKAPYDRPE